MVMLQVKRKDEAVFLCEMAVSATVETAARSVAALHNGRLKVERVCLEVEQLAAHGTMLPPEMLGLTDDQVAELRLTDPWGERSVPSGGPCAAPSPDPSGRRNGARPRLDMQHVLTGACEEARRAISKQKVQLREALTEGAVREALDVVRGAVAIVYPMQLPPHDPIRMEFENVEDLEGTQASLEVVDPAAAQLWFCGREMHRDGGRTLVDYVGTNENTKVIVKLTKRGEGPPAREPALNEEDRKQFMLHAYRKQEELKRLEADEDDAYLASEWADGSNLKRAFHGLNNISWRPGK